MDASSPGPLRARRVAASAFLAGRSGTGRPVQPQGGRWWRRLALEWFMSHQRRAPLRSRRIDEGYHVRKILELNMAEFSAVRNRIVAVANAGISLLASQLLDGAQPTCAVPENLLKTLSADCEWQVRMACSLVDFHFATEQDVARGNGDYQKINDLIRPRWRRQLSLGPLPGLDVKWP